MPGQAISGDRPWPGRAHQPLLERLGRLCVIELDRDLAQRLRTQAALTVVQADVECGLLCADSPLGQAARGGQLAHNISTPSCFTCCAMPMRLPTSTCCKEVVQRMVAARQRQPWAPEVMLQWRYAAGQRAGRAAPELSPPPAWTAQVRMVPLAQAQCRGRGFAQRVGCSGF